VIFVDEERFEMQASPISGYNAYAQFSEKNREVVKADFSVREHKPEQVEVSSRASDTEDIISISDAARNASAALSASREAVAREAVAQETARRETSTQAEFKEWARETAMKSEPFTQRVSGQQLGELLSGSGISVEKDESFDINVDKWGIANVTSRNAEKAKDVQALLNSTPRMLNWGLMLQKLPIDR